MKSSAQIGDQLQLVRTMRDGLYTLDSTQGEASIKVDGNVIVKIFRTEDELCVSIGKDGTGAATVVLLGLAS